MATERVARLRRCSLDAKPSISDQRARLMTDFYCQHTELESAPVFRARSFQYLLENEDIFIANDELIVGEKGQGPKASPTYPELCCHSLEDLAILDQREKIPFAVSAETRRLYAAQIIPFWKGRTMREKIFAEMTQAWKDCYAAGIYTEFMEQRAPGHTVLDDKIYRKGMLDFQQDIEASLERLDFLNDPQATGKRDELRAMHIAAGAIIRFAERHAQNHRRSRSGLAADAACSANLPKALAHVPHPVSTNLSRRFG